MKILVTGAAGYLSNMIIRDLLKREDVEKVIGIDSLEYKTNTFWDICDDPRFHFVRADILSVPELLEDLYREADVILPNAGPVGYPKSQFYKMSTWALNHATIADMLLYIRTLGKHVIYLNSNSGYGIRPGEDITEDMPLHPISEYGKSKVAAEATVLSEGHVSLRLGTVAGVSPCMRLDLLVNDFVFRAVKDNVITIFQGNASRNLVGIKDVSKAVLFAIDNFEVMLGKPFNVGDINLTKLELAQKVAEYTGCHVVEAEFAEDKDKRDYRISCQAIKDLGFKFEQNLDSLIKQLVKFYSTISLTSSNVRFENQELMSLI